MALKLKLADGSDYRALCVVIGALLLISALLKRFYPAMSGDPALYFATWQKIAGLQVELLIGLSLLFGLCPRFTWIATVGLFTVFAAISLHHALARYPSCGCFGAVNVSPRLTLALDVGIVAALVAKRRSPFDQRRKLRRLRTSLASLASYVVIGGIMFLPWIGTAQASTRPGVLQDGKLVILEPTKWVGQQLPISEEITPKVIDSNGTEIILLFHDGCDECQKALARYQQLAGEKTNNRDEQRVTVVEVPPFDGLTTRSGPVRWARLSADREWFVSTPIEIQVRRGEVTLVSYDLPSVVGIP